MDLNGAKHINDTFGQEDDPQVSARPSLEFVVGLIRWSFSEFLGVIRIPRDRLSINLSLADTEPTALVESTRPAWRKRDGYPRDKPCKQSFL